MAKPKSIAQYLDAKDNSSPTSSGESSNQDVINAIQEQHGLIEQLVLASKAVEELIKQANNRTYDYDAEGKLVTAKYWKDGGLLATQSFTYDENDNLIGEVWK